MAGIDLKKLMGPKHAELKAISEQTGRKMSDIVRSGALMKIAQLKRELEPILSNTPETSLSAKEQWLYGGKSLL